MAYYMILNNHPLAETIEPAPANKKPSLAKKGGRKATCRSGTHSSGAKSQEQTTCGNKAHTLSEFCSHQYGIPGPEASTTTGRSRHRNRRDIDYLSLNDGPDEEVQRSPKHKKRVFYTPNRKGPAAQHVALSEKAVTTSTALKGVQVSSLKAVPLVDNPKAVATSTTLTGIQVLSSETVPLPAIPA